MARPRVSADRGHADLQPTAARCGVVEQRRSGHGQPWPFARPVRHVDERAPTLDEVVLSAVVPKVRGDVDVRDRRSGTEQRVTGPAADRHGLHRPVRVAADADSVRCRREAGSHEIGERTEGHRGGELADTAGADGRIVRRGCQRTGVDEAERVCERVTDPRGGAVGVGVRGVQRDAVRYESVHDPALVADGGDRMHPAQEQRMVGDDEVRLLDQCLVDDGKDRVDGEQDPPDGRVGVAAGQADGIPVLGEDRRVPLLQHSDDIADAERRRSGHGLRLRIAGQAGGPRLPGLNQANLCGLTSRSQDSRPVTTRVIRILDGVGHRAGAREEHTMSTRTITVAGAAALVAATLLTVSPAASAAATTDTNPHPVALLVREGTITPQEWRETRRAIRQATEDARDSSRTTALSPLVAAGTISQADLETIVDARGRVGIARLAARDDITRSQAMAIRDALRGRERIDRPTAIDSALAELLSDGTLTREQADAVDAALAARRSQHAATRPA